MELMYHYILMNELKMIAEKAAGFSIHGLKHFIITAATQLEIDRDAVVKLGHWHSNSAMLDKYNQSKCVRELTTRTTIQQQFVAGWRPVGGAELANEWIEFEDDREESSEGAPRKQGAPRKHGGPKMRPPKSVNCKFRQAKLKSRGLEPTVSSEILSQVSEASDQNDKSKPELPLEKTLVKSGNVKSEQAQSGQPLRPVKRMNTREWIQYPENIKNNEVRVVQSDAKTHFFNGADASYCATYKCGTIEHVRLGVSFFHDVPDDVTKSTFCSFCRRHKKNVGGWAKGLNAIQRPDLPAINH